MALISQGGSLLCVPSLLMSHRLCPLCTRDKINTQTTPAARAGCGDEITCPLHLQVKSWSRKNKENAFHWDPDRQSHFCSCAAPSPSIHQPWELLLTPHPSHWGSGWGCAPAAPAELPLLLSSWEKLSVQFWIRRGPGCVTVQFLRCVQSTLNTQPCFILIHHCSSVAATEILLTGKSVFLKRAQTPRKIKKKIK